MKQILVPTDFSDDAHAALQYALIVAQRTGAKVRLMHAYDVVSSTGLFPQSQALLQQKVRKYLSEEWERLDPVLREGVKVQNEVFQGAVLPAIKEAMDATDLLVMGFRGASGLKRIFEGSTTNQVIQAGLGPLLVVQDEYFYLPIRRIAFALDGEVTDYTRIAQPVRALARAFNASIQFFHLDKGREVSPRLRSDLDNFFRDVSHSIQIEWAPGKIPNNINEFVEEEQADLLVLVHRNNQYQWLQDFFQRSIASQELFTSEVPLLILQA